MHTHIQTHTLKIQGMDKWVKAALVSTVLRDTLRGPWSLTRASGMSDVLFLPRILFGLAQLHKNLA